MFKRRKPQPDGDKALLCSSLFNQNDFYPALRDDLKKVKTQAIIESPFITLRRLNTLMPTFRMLRERGVQIVVNTKPPAEHEPALRVQAEIAVQRLQSLGVLVLLTAGHHRKLALLDKCITWEGSLNILSQNDSCEVMRRIHSEQIGSQTLAFLNLDEFLG